MLCYVEKVQTFRRDQFPYFIEANFLRKLGFMDPTGLSPSSDPAQILEGVIGATDAIRKCEYGKLFPTALE